MKLRIPQSLSRPTRAALVSAAAATLLPLLERSAAAQPVPIYGGPNYDAATGNGYQNASFSGAIGTPVSSTGLAVGYADFYSAGVNKLTRAVLLSGNGNAIQLTSLTTDPSVAAKSQVYTINTSGQSVGFANKQVGGVNLGDRAVRWDSAGNYLELAMVGDGTGSPASYAYGINAAGVSVGSASKYVASVYQGDIPVRWSAAGAVTELGSITTSKVFGSVFSINASNQAVGQMSSYVSNNYKGERAVAWNAAGTALELGNLGLSNQSSTNSFAYAINTSGQVAGYSAKYTTSVSKGDRAVRWNATTGAATELANLGTDSSSTTYSYAFAINDAGQIAGRSYKYVGGVFAGDLAVRWDADGSAHELGNLGLSSTNTTTASAFAINSLGQTAGRCKLYVSGVDQGDRAVYWKADGSIVDLNSLISPSSNWTLTRSRGISDNGWITGFGMYDPDGAGTVAPYQRQFLLNVNTENNWLNSTGGAWATGNNWFTNFAPGSSVSALFNLNSSGGYTVDLSGAPAQAKDVIVKTDKIALNVGGNSVAFNSFIVGRDSGDVARLTMNGGTVTLASGVTIANTAGTTGTFNLDAGTLTAPSIISKGNFNYNGGSLSATSVQLAGVGLMKFPAGGTRTLKLTTLTIADTARLDLVDNKLILQSGGTGVGAWNGSNYTGATGLLKSGHTPAGNWSGSGLVTSMTAATTSTARTLAIATASQTGISTFGGVSVSGNDALVMYTFSGDANLSGSVDADDYFRIDSNYGKTSNTIKSFFNGDFNYDGLINGDDYALIDAGFSAQLSPAAPLGVSPVPEPTGVLSVLGVLLAVRRQRRHHAR